MVAVGNDNAQEDWIQKSVLHSMCVVWIVLEERFVLGKPVNKKWKGVKGLKNRKSNGKDEVIGQVIEKGSGAGIDWVWKLCYMAFNRGVVPEDMWIAVIVP